MSNYTDIMKKISDGSETVGIIGLGYVGLPLAVTFARNNVTVLGFEKSSKKSDAVNKADNYIGDVEDSDLEKGCA